MRTFTKVLQILAPIVVVVLAFSLVGLGQGKQKAPPSNYLNLQILDDVSSTLEPGTFNYPSTEYEVKDLDGSLWFNAYAGTNVSFQNLTAGESGLNPGSKVCGFPGWSCETGEDIATSGFPLCLTEFLRMQSHPALGYNRILFRFFYPSGVTTQTQVIGTKVPIQHWRFYLEGQNVLGSCAQCSDCERHTITGNAHAVVPTTGDPDMYVERIDAGTWKVHVDTRFENPEYSTGYPENPDPYSTDMLYSEYCTCEQVPGSNPKKPIYNKVSHISAWTRIPMKFDMVFSRN